MIYRLTKTTAKTIIAGLAVTTAVVSLNVGIASAHVVVKPAEAGIASFQTFTTSVPNEKDVAIIKIRLTVPDGLKSISPTVKPGWTINEVKDGSGDNAVVKEITWSGGSVPAGQRDDFTFGAQVQAKPTTIQWKAYQTYADGSEVSWDQKPNGSDDSTGDKGPYSETKVINDLTQTSAAGTAMLVKSADNSRTNIAIALSVVALVLSAMALASKKTAKHKQR